MIFEPNCSKRECKHFTGMEGEDELSQIVVCAAFPDGIPDEIAYGTVMHNEPYANDHGIQYEKAQED